MCHTWKVELTTVAGTQSSHGVAPRHSPYTSQTQSTRKATHSLKLAQVDTSDTWSAVIEHRAENDSPVAPALCQQHVDFLKTGASEEQEAQASDVSHMGGNGNDRYSMPSSHLSGHLAQAAHGPENPQWSETNENPIDAMLDCSDKQSFRGSTTVELGEGFDIVTLSGLSDRDLEHIDLDSALFGMDIDFEDPSMVSIHRSRTLLVYKLTRSADQHFRFSFRVRVRPGRNRLRRGWRSVHVGKPVVRQAIGTGR